MSILDKAGINDGRQEISREDYACVLARFYALCVGKHTRGILGKNPYAAQLDEEHKLISQYMEKVKCRETDVVKRVRELIPETGWDQGLMNSLERLYDEASTSGEWGEAAEKIKAFNGPNGLDIANLEDLLDRS